MDSFIILFNHSLRKSDFKESFHAVGKISLNRRDYWLVKIAQEDI